MKKKEEHLFLFFLLRTGRDSSLRYHPYCAAVCIHLITLQINERQQNTHSQLNEHTV